MTTVDARNFRFLDGLHMAYMVRMRMDDTALSSVFGWFEIYGTLPWEPRFWPKTLSDNVGDSLDTRKISLVDTRLAKHLT